MCQCFYFFYLIIFILFFYTYYTNENVEVTPRGQPVAYVLLEPERHFCSVVMDAGSRGTTAHAHQCCRSQGYPEATVPSRMKLIMREPASMTRKRGHGESYFYIAHRPCEHTRGLFPWGYLKHVSINGHLLNRNVCIPVLLISLLTA